MQAYWYTLCPSFCTCGAACMNAAHWGTDRPWLHASKQADSAASADFVECTGIVPEGGNAIFGAVKGLMPITTRRINGLINLSGGPLKNIKQSHMKMQVLPDLMQSTGHASTTVISIMHTPVDLACKAPSSLSLSLSLSLPLHLSLSPPSLSRLYVC